MVGEFKVHHLGHTTESVHCHVPRSCPLYTSRRRCWTTAGAVAVMLLRRAHAAQHLCRIWPRAPVSRWCSLEVCHSSLTDLMRQYRTLDDQVILHFNRASAHSRDTGESAPPSLLQKHSTQFYSTSARDLGKSTYASVPNDVCAQFWQHLVKVWSEREDAIRYCISVTEKAHVPTTADNSDLRLDGDARAAPDVQSRSEHMDEFLMRQLRNELTIETIIRLRSLEAFKERCRVFAPSGNDARELEYWAGK